MDLTNRSPEARTLLAAVGDLVPLVAKHAEEGQRERRLPEPLVRAFTEAGVFRMSRPKAYGGLEVDPLTSSEVVEQIARADGSAGWVAMINGTGTAFEAQVAPEGGQEMFSDKATVSGGVVAPTGKAVQVEGGYRISGRWAIASGCQHSQWLGASCFVFDGDAPRMGPHGMPEWIAPFIPKSDFEIIDTWDVGGLRGTGSHDFVVNDAFVPERRVIHLPIMGPAQQPGALYKFPFFGFLALSIASTSLGIARAAIDELKAMAAKKTPFGMMSTLSTRATAQLATVDAEVLLDSSRAFLRAAAEDLWRVAQSGEVPSVAQRLRLRMAATSAAVNCASAVDLMYTAGGASSLYAKSPLLKAHRDAHAVTQHYAVAPSSREMFGRIALGIDPDAPTL